MNISSSGLSKKRRSLRVTLVGALVGPICIVVLSWLLADASMRIILVLMLASLAGAITARFINALAGNRSYLRKIALGLLTLFSFVLVYFAIMWKSVSDRGGQVRQEPFCIAGNLYYVGTKDVTSFLLTSSKGHVLIDGGYPGTADMIIKNIGILGFKITDVKILLNSHAHIDHAGGLAALQKKSGAQLWVSQQDAEMIEAGGAGTRNMSLINLAVYLGLAKFPAPRLDHLVKDGTKIRIDSIELTAHVTPGHTPGCTSWAFPVKDGNRDLLAVSIGSLTLLPTSLFGQQYDDVLQNEFRQSFKILRSIPADIFLGSHASFFSMGDKLKQRDTAANPVTPFIDRAGYLKHIDNAEEKLSKALRQQQEQSIKK